MSDEYLFLWCDAMKEELNSMTINLVWKLVELTKGASIFGCRWVYKAKLDAFGDVKRTRPDL